MNPDSFQKAILFAAEAHASQKFPGKDLPYFMHLAQVATEVMAAGCSELSVLCAWLHDTIEDTETTYETLQGVFGVEVALGVLALTKNSELPKEQRMADSLERILQQPPDIACVKMADRICNLQCPPHYWTPEKIAEYREEARQILAALGASCPVLAQRLEEKIAAYPPPPSM
ncbi:MAG: HD domain-containing protein [Armatimonas sp.]